MFIFPPYEEWVLNTKIQYFSGNQISIQPSYLSIHFSLSLPIKIQIISRFDRNFIFRDQMSQHILQVPKIVSEKRIQPYLSNAVAAFWSFRFVQLSLQHHRKNEDWHWFLVSSKTEKHTWAGKIFYFSQLFLDRRLRIRFSRIKNGPIFCAII